MAKNKKNEGGSALEPLEKDEIETGDDVVGTADAGDSPEPGGAPPSASLGRPPIDSEAAARLQAEADQRAQDQARADMVARATIDAEIRAQYAEREKLRPMPPITASVSAEAARPDDECEIWQFPRPCFIWAEPDEKHPKRYKVAFGKGLQRVPKSLLGNWYLERVGKPYVAKI